jgi:hypothetical protein
MDALRQLTLQHALLGPHIYFYQRIQIRIFDFFGALAPLARVAANGRSRH